MLYVGAAYAARAKFIGGRTSTGLGVIGAVRDRAQTPWLDLARTFGSTLKSSSVPDGYRGGVATSMAVADGGMAARLFGGGEVTLANIGALGVMSASPSGSGNITYANLAAGINMVCLASGIGNLTSNDLRGKAALNCVINTGAQPSAEDIAQAVWNYILNGNTSPGNAAEKLKKALTRDEFLGLS